MMTEGLLQEIERLVSTGALTSASPAASAVGYRELLPVVERGEGSVNDAVALITKTGQASISMIQRHLRIGYNRAARIIEKMEKEGIVGPSDGAKPRDVLVTSYDRKT